MEAVKAISYILINDTDLAAVVPNVYAGTMSQSGTFPYIVISTIANEPADTKSGASTLDTYRLQIDNYSTTYKQAADVAIMIRRIIDRHAHQEINGVSLNGVNFISWSDDYETETKTHRVISEYYIRVKR